MRVTQSMLANSNLKYISKNYDSLAKLQDQLMTGKKITKPSDDPVVAMKGMRYRTQANEVDQFRRNLNEGFNWMENADSALDETDQVLQRIRELVVQASNDSYEEGARKNIEKEISQLQQHIIALANTKVGENYIFNGTNTAEAPINESLFNVDFDTFVGDLSDPVNADFKPDDYIISYKGQTFKYDETTGQYVVEPKITYEVIKDIDTKEKEEKQGYLATIKIDPSTKEITLTRLEKQDELDGTMLEKTEKLSSTDLVVSRADAVSTNTQSVQIEVMKGVKIPININSQNAFSIELFSGLESIKKMLTDPSSTGAEITKALDSIDGYLNDIVSTRAELGAQVNRAEMVDSRLLEEKSIAKKTVSDNEDIDLEEVIINLTIQESIHRASLAVGARIIQPTLMDFLG